MARKTTNKKASPNTMWGGRYALGPAEIMERINASIGFDRKLYAQDIAGSLAHADMLGAQGILSAKDGRAIRQGLGRIKAAAGHDRDPWPRRSFGRAAIPPQEI